MQLYEKDGYNVQGILIFRGSEARPHWATSSGSTNLGSAHQILLCPANTFVFNQWLLGLWIIVSVSMVCKALNDQLFCLQSKKVA